MMLKDDQAMHDRVMEKLNGMTKDEKKDFLVKVGILDENFKLTERYGGEATGSVTVAQIAALDPCLDGLNDFKVFLKGADSIELTEENFKLALKAGLGVRWAVEKGLIPRHLALLDPLEAYYYAKNVDKCPRDDTRAAAMADPNYALLYARGVDKGPREDTRAATLADPWSAYSYANYIDKCPRDDTRAAALAIPNFAYRYAKNVDECPRDDTRAAAMADPDYAYYYAKNVDKEKI